jgi:hypothetical protein
MNLRHVALLTLVGLPACGCCRNPRFDVYVETLNAEKRALEDELYDLEYDYEVVIQDLEACQRENEKLRKEGGGPPAAPADEAPAPEGPDSEFDDLSPPTIEPGLPESPDFELPFSQPGGDLGAPPSPEAAPDKEASGEPQTDGPIDTRVTHIVLDPRHTGGQSFDGEPGDEGISVLVEPRNAADQYVPQAGSLSIVVLDPAKEGQQARVARWDLDSLEADRYLQRSSQRGIHWRSPWPGDAPEHVKLDLFVRFTTIDGRTLAPVHQQIFVAAADQIANCWTPRRSERREANQQEASQRETDQEQAGQEQAGGESDDRIARQESPASKPAADAARPADPGGAEQTRPVWRPYR